MQVSINNAGGIRAPIGQVSDDGELLPPQENPTAGKSTGEISQLDIESSLQFNNGLSLLTVTAAELEILIEHGVSSTQPGALPGQFPQIGGLAFSFDPDRPAAEDLNGNQVLDENEDLNGNGVLDLGERVRSLAIADTTGTVVDVIARDGELVGDPNREIRLVTSTFLANGGDDYPFDIFGDNRVDLTTVLTDEGTAQAAAPGTEQDAFAEFLAANFADTPFNNPETPIEADTRIQNLAERTDTVVEESSNNAPVAVDDSVSAAKNTAKTILADDLLVNDTDADDNLLTLTAVSNSVNGTVSLDTNGDVVFTPTEGFNGTASFDYTVSDDTDTDTGSVTVEVGNILNGTNKKDTLTGGAGDDVISGGNAPDKLYGGAGDDILGSEGNENGPDVLVGGQGNDTLTGGKGPDLFVLAAGEGTDTITDFSKPDSIGLSGGIGLSDLSFSGNDIILTSTSEVLAMLKEVDTTTLKSSDFTTV